MYLHILDTHGFRNNTHVDFILGYFVIYPHIHTLGIYRIYYIIVAGITTILWDFD